MSRFSVYVQHLLRYDADALVLVSNEPIVLRFATGDRKATQTTDHAQLVALVQESAPPEALSTVRGGRSARFVVDEQGTPIQVEVTPSPGAWRVVVAKAPGELRPPSVSPPPPAPVRAPIGSRPEPRAVPTPGQTPLEPRAAVGRDATSMLDLWLLAMSKKGASDLHLTTGRPPLVRLHGEIKLLDEREPALTSERLRELIFATMPEKNREEFERRRDTDWAHELPGTARFRGNAFVDRQGVGAVFRRIPFEILPPEALGISKQVLELCNLTKGLVLVTGPTGSGKSTTLATLVDVINTTRDDHIITIEDPIEFVHQNKRCLVNQREVGVHTDSFKSALRAALREDPDVVLVGEMRDLETIAIAIETAETGHLVFGTLHTTTAPGAVDRIIDQFPSDRQAQIRTMLSESLKGVIAQVLCKKKAGGRAAAYEVLIGIPAVANLIREGKTFQIPSTMQVNRAIGMCTMSDSLIELVKRDLIEPKEAYLKAVNKGEIKTMLAQAGFPVAGV